jgi:hypothetical protein
MSPGGHDDDSPPGAELRTHTIAAGTMWLTQTPALSLWKGEVGLLDWLRVETKEGSVVELKLARATAIAGTLRVGRPKPGMTEPPEVAHELFTSSQAALLRWDGMRWWLKRRAECHERVPTVVGARSLSNEEEAPLVHGTFFQVGRARGTFVDRRYVVPAVPAGAVDPLTGLLGRIGFEQELAGFLGLSKRGSVLLLAAPASALSAPAGEHPAIARAVHSLHAAWPRLAIMHDEGVIAVLAGEDVGSPIELATRARRLAEASGLEGFATGVWTLSPDVEGAARELTLSRAAITSALTDARDGSVLDLRAEFSGAPRTSREELTSVLADRRRATVLFGIEESAALARVSPRIVPALSQELSAVVQSLAPSRALVAEVAPGVVAASLPPGELALSFAADVQREWHTRAPVADGQVEHPRTLCFELASGDVLARAAELSRECADPNGALSSLSGGLPYPIAGRVQLAMSAGSAVERVKLLFDVLEGSWRLVACILAAAYFARRPDGSAPAAMPELSVFAKSLATRGAYPLGKWRELGRILAKGLQTDDTALGQLARELLRTRQDESETLEALANQLHPLRNQFAHSVYPEARARQDLPAFEQVTREFLRALRPLGAWTLVTIEKTEPDLYGDTQLVEYVDHTGPSEAGARRRVGLKSPVRLANVVYLARWREGLVVPLEPFVRRHARGHSFDLFWAQRLPTPGLVPYSAVVHGGEIELSIEERRLPPGLRDLAPK